MIVIDTSVFIALVQREADSDRFRDVIMTSPQVVMSAGTYLECAIVAGGRGLGGRRLLDAWLAARNIGILPVDMEVAQIAADAFATYGKGRHPAGLNYGDCFAYALAKSLRAPLLYKGEDFARTDLTSALPR